MFQLLDIYPVSGIFFELLFMQYDIEKVKKMFKVELKFNAMSLFWYFKFNYK